MTQPLDFQSIIMTLQHFWAEQGCVIWQPYYTQVGAGTLNPATALRVLGPEPWNVGYVEPTVRPDDGRYGENPNRLQMHYQFQVILKPDPGNPQELYLRSLEALGVDPRQHDIRFVEDNWESPALGAWGLGWEVWLDGQEITQFTYFQQAGGQPTDPVSVEITYGLDRIAIALQRVHGFTEIRWNTAPEGGRSLTCGDVNLQGEREHSTYYFDVADVERLRQMYDLCEQEAVTCLEKGLVLPAHDYVLRCSHTFNVLDARGAIGLTERQAYFRRMRDLSRRVSDAYLAQRQHLEYPWLNESDAPAAGQAAALTAPAALPAPAPFVLEIGTEELPATDLDAVLEQLKTRLEALLGELRLGYGELRVLGTPRRLAAYATDLAPQQPDLEQVVKGPPAARAFDASGNPTPAAEGFARGKGVAVSDLQVREIDGGQYVTAVVRQAGRPAAQVLGDALPGLIGALRFDKSMRWNSTNVAFSRPVRWLLALHGAQVVPVSYAGLTAGHSTRGLRFAAVEEIPVPEAADYFRILAGQGILLDKAERQQSILQQVAALAAEVGGEALDDPALLAEVANLIEAPAALRGSFDAAYLSLPREVLVSVMKKHQRYFPVLKPGGKAELLPYFITVANKVAEKPGQCEGAALIIEGNQHVIRARFADADFFVRDDQKHTLADFLPRLKTLTFQTRLGTMLDKARRVAAMVDRLVQPCGLSPEEADTALRAAALCKADLATRMVVEMTSLQGVMGRYYALRSGESQAVADAILEHYLPRFAGDALPQGKAGFVVGLADRLDTLAGLFAAGLAPTGAKDPFAQRRAALGLVQMLIGQDQDLDLSFALGAAAQNLPIESSEESRAACQTFIVERLRNLLLEMGHKHDIVEAVVAAQGRNPALAGRAVRALAAWVARPDWNTILPAYARCVRITRDQAERFTVDPAGLAEEAEKALYTALQQAEAAPRAYGSVDDFLNAFVPMIPAVSRFFDDVLVMAEDANVRRNRLGLLQRIAALAEGVADFSRLEGF